MIIWVLHSFLQFSRLRRVGDLGYRKSGASNFFGGRNITLGRLVVDTLLSSKELVNKMTNYEIPSLSQKLFNLPIPEAPQLEYNRADKLQYFVAYSFDEMVSRIRFCLVVH